MIFVCPDVYEKGIGPALILEVVGWDAEFIDAGIVGW